MSTPSDHQAFQYQELNQLNNALTTLQRLGIPASNPAYQAIYGARGAAISKLGLNLPRTTSLVRVLLGLSPGELRLFRDAEIGWLVEIVEAPGAAPVRKYVTDEIADLIFTNQLTHELFMQLAAPEDPFIA